MIHAFTFAEACAFVGITIPVPDNCKGVHICDTLGECFSIVTGRRRCNYYTAEEWLHRCITPCHWDGLLQAYHRSDRTDPENCHKQLIGTIEPDRERTGSAELTRLRYEAYKSEIRARRHSHYVKNANRYANLRDDYRAKHPGRVSQTNQVRRAYIESVMNPLGYSQNNCGHPVSRGYTPISVTDFKNKFPGLLD